jgi:polynucleotide 5'-hydroxyl-kinase GRC3/NOL9
MAAFRRIRKLTVTSEDTREDNDIDMDLDEAVAGQKAEGGMAMLQTSLIAASPEGLPFIRNTSGGNLDPRYSQSLGLALVRGIDAEKGEMQILSPLPLDKIEGAIRNGRRIVLVSGKLDPPSWSYTEDLYNRSFESVSGDANGNDSFGSMDEDTDDDPWEFRGKEAQAPLEQPEAPWVEMLHGNQKRAVGSRVWRVRRDLGRSGNITEL